METEKGAQQDRGKEMRDKGSGGQVHLISEFHFYLCLFVHYPRMNSVTERMM